MRLLLAMMFVATTTTTTPASTGTNNECSDMYFACMAHATTQQQRNVCRADYLACARRIGDE